MYSVLAYYYIGHIDNPSLEMEKHKEFFRTRDFKCRIYISEQGINGQSSGREDHAEEYIAWMRADARFKDIDFKIQNAINILSQRRLSNMRKQLVALDYKVDFSKRREHLPRNEWKKRMQIKR